VNTQIEAIVLKSFDYQDHHKIVKMISPSYGLFSVFVGYANKQKSRNRALAEPLSCVSVSVKEPQNSTDGRGGLYYLVHGEVLDAFYELKMDYELVMMFYEMAEVILYGDIDLYHLPYTYRMLRSVLALDADDALTFRFGVAIFKAKMMTAIGMLPAVDGCVFCGTTTQIVTASVNEGGLICEACYSRSGIWLEIDLIPLWRALFKSPLDSLLKLEIGEADLEMLENWIAAYYDSYSNVRFAKRLTI